MPHTGAWWLFLLLLAVPFVGRERSIVARPIDAGQVDQAHTTDEPAVAQSRTCSVLAGVVPESPGRSIKVVADTLLMDPRGESNAWQRRGCFLSVVDTASRSGAPVNLLDDWFRTNGWQSVLAYSADGPDGTMFAFEGAGELCVVVGGWDGGDDSDPTVVPAPGFTISVGCAPAIPPGTAP